MKRGILLITLITVIQCMSAVAQWSAVASIYGGLIASDGALSFSVNSKGYVLAGSSTNAWYEYDSLLNQWTNMGNVPALMGTAFGMSFVINNKAYIVGGDTSGVPMNTVWEFDPTATNPWIQKNDFPGGVRDAGFAFSIDGYGYVGAGFDGTNLYNDIWKYDQPNDSWSLLPDTLPCSGLLFPTSFVVGNYGYVLTGGTPPNGVNETNQMWRLDGYTGAITARANFPGTVRQACLSFSNQNYGYVGGGQAGFVTNYFDMHRYDPANNQWDPAANAPMLGAAWSSTFVIGNTAYCGLGAKFTATGLTGNDIFYKMTMDISLGVENINSSSLTLYPNPATDFINLTSKNEIEKIKIYNVGGELVDEINLPKENIYVGELADGFYTVYVYEKDNVGVMKFVKQ